jgi:hypothetical protein
MKKTNYFLALALAAAPVTAYAAEGQDSQSQWAMTDTAVQGQEGHGGQTGTVGHTEQTGNAEFAVYGKEIIVTNAGGNTSTIKLTSPNIKFKPHQSGEADYQNNKFVGLWKSGKQYGKTNPSATLAWKNNEHVYEMIATISKANGGKDNLTLVASDPNVSFHKDGQTITKEEFLEAASAKGKEDIAVWVNEAGFVPSTGTGSTTHQGTGSETGTEHGSEGMHQ